MNEVGLQDARELITKAVPGVEFDLEEMDIITDQQISIEGLLRLKPNTIQIGMDFLATHNLLSYGAYYTKEQHIDMFFSPILEE